MAEGGTGARLAVDRVSDGGFIGWCSLNRWNPDYRSASLGYCFDDAAWGHGYATEAARALLRWAFDTLDLNRVQAETDTRNVASARVLEKLGFVREGTLREDCVVNGEVSDSWVYGLIRREWRPSSERFPPLSPRPSREVDQTLESAAPRPWTELSGISVAAACVRCGHPEPPWWKSQRAGAGTATDSSSVAVAYPRPKMNVQVRGGLSVSTRRSEAETSARIPHVAKPLTDRQRRLFRRSAACSPPS